MYIPRMRAVLHGYSVLQGKVENTGLLHLMKSGLHLWVKRKKWVFAMEIAVFASVCGTVLQNKFIISIAI